MSTNGPLRHVCAHGPRLPSWTQPRAPGGDGHVAGVLCLPLTCARSSHKCPGVGGCGARACAHTLARVDSGADSCTASHERCPWIGPHGPRSWGLALCVPFSPRPAMADTRTLAALGPCCALAPHLTHLRDFEATPGNYAVMEFRATDPQDDPGVMAGRRVVQFPYLASGACHAAADSAATTSPFHISS